MAQILGIDHRYIVLPALAVTGGIAAYSTWRLCTLKKKSDKENIYETQKSLNEYLLFHYGAPKEVMKYDFGPQNGFNFPKRCADLCLKHCKTGTPALKRALDIGCAVGRSSFELTSEFTEVVGIDYSNAFVEACNTLKGQGRMNYSMVKEGELGEEFLAQIDSDLDRSRAVFRVGDACNLPMDLGQFECVLAANLICRLHTPHNFFARLPSLVTPGGILVITSPYTFLTDYTPRENMIGAVRNADGTELTAIKGMMSLLSPYFELVTQEDMPFVIRETSRKYQWTVAHATVWRRLKQ